MSESAPLGVLATFISITIAIIGIVNSFVLSRYNERASRRRAILGGQLNELQVRIRELPGNLFERSVGMLTNELNKTLILTTRYIRVFWGIPSLALFLASFFISYSLNFGGSIFPWSIQIDISIANSMAHVLFVLGVVLLIPYVIFIMMLLWAFLKSYSPKKCQGKLSWTDPKDEDRPIARSFRKEDLLKVDVSFDGIVANGFIDTLLVYTNGEVDFQIWVPDKLTYLSPTSYSIYGNLIIDKDLDTGVLQGHVKEVFHLEFRVGESSHKPKVIDYLWRGRLAPVYEDYYVPEKMQVKELRIRMYVDPLHSPRLERNFLDELVIRNSDPLESER